MGLLAGWGQYIAAFAVFFLSHTLPVRPPVKAAIVARIGGKGFTLAYSALSVLVLGWLIAAAGRAPYVQLWPFAPWQAHLTQLAMALSVALVALALGRPNPLSFGGARNAHFDPAQPGIVGWMRHPLLAALLLWSLGHIPPNGNLAHVILFATFAGFAGLGMRVIDRRKRREMGGAEWRRLAGTARRVAPTAAGALRLALAALAYVGLLWLHPPVIGVSPLP